MDVTIKGLILEPVWIRPDDVDRVGRLSGKLNKTYSEIIHEALKWYEDCLTVAEKLCDVDFDEYLKLIAGGDVDDSRGRGEAT